MAENKKSFIVYCDWKDVFNELSDDEAGKLIKHIFSYVSDENPVLEDKLLKMCFIPIEKTLKRDLKKYEQYVDKQRINGKKGGRPIKAKKPNPLIENPTQPKKADSVSVSVSDSDSDSVSDSVSVSVNKKFADAKELINYMNDIGTCRYSFSNKNITSANARIKEHGLELMKKVLELKIWQTKQKRKDGNYIFDRKYFRPETIFNPNKAESYVNEVLSIQNGITDPNENKTQQSGFNDAANRLLEKYKKSIEKNN